MQHFMQPLLMPTCMGITSDVMAPLRAAALLCTQAVLVRSDGKAVWEPGPNHQAELQGSKDVSLFHVFKA